MTGAETCRTSVESRGRPEWLQGALLAIPLLAWPFLAHPGPTFLAYTFLLLVIPLCAARTAPQLIMVLFAYYAVDGYLRLLFEYSWEIYMLPLFAAALVYVRWFLGPQWRRSRSAVWSNPVSIPLVGLVTWYGLQMFNGVPWNPIVSAGGFVYHLGAVPLFFIAATGFEDGRDIRHVLWFILSLVSFECLYALAQYYVGPPEPLALSLHYQARMAAEAWWGPGSPELVYRPTGFTLSGGGPGMYGLIGIVLALGLFEGWRSALWRKLAVLLGVFVMLVAVFLSAVRALWVGLLVALIVFGVLEGVRYLTVVVGLGWGAAAVAISWTRGALYQRLSTLIAPWGVFSRDRGWDLLQLPSIIAQYPMGIGIGRAAGSAAGQARQLLPEGLYGAAHNYWVSITWEASLLAPLLLGWLLWQLWRFGVSVLRHAPNRSTRGVVAAILALDAGIIAMTLAGPALAGLASSLAQYFWFVSGLLVAVHRALPQPLNASGRRPRHAESHPVPSET